MALQTFKQFLENVDPLKSVEIEMFFRQELDLPTDAAREAAMWMTDEKDWGDLEHDARDLVLDYVVHHIPHIYEHPSHVIIQKAFDLMAKIMYDKYGVEL